MVQPTRDQQTVSSDGQSVASRIAGVTVRMATTLPDERGELCEIYNPAWGFSDAPLVYVYQVAIRPGRVKGWVVHYEQDDRLFISTGVFKIVLYDGRLDSPTHGQINVLHLGERNRGLLLIPRGVYHAMQNIGQTEAIFLNMPTRAYQHEKPDKYRLPLDTDLIPYRFDDRLGW